MDRLAGGNSATLGIRSRCPKLAAYARHTAATQWRNPRTSGLLLVGVIPSIRYSGHTAGGGRLCIAGGRDNAASGPRTAASAGRRRYAGGGTESWSCVWYREAVDSITLRGTGTAIARRA